MAAELCPTRSLGTRSRQRWAPHHPLELRPGIWRCGGNAWSSAGGNSYLIQRPGGNVLLDAPRWSARLADRLTALGGIAAVVLTHADDVADSERYARHFGARVWIHEGDRDAAPFASDIGAGREPFEIADGALVIPTPGHTPGHVMLLVDATVLFSGDSLAWDPGREGLWAEEAVCWYSWPEQLASLEHLFDHTFDQVVPSHGALSPVRKPEQLHRSLRDLLDELSPAAGPSRR